MGDDRGRRWGRAALRLVPLLLALTVLGAVVGSLVGLLTSAHPDVGYFRSNTHDALALLTGQGIFNPPGEGYTGLLYTPGLPVLLAGLNALHVWQGWAPLVTMVSVLVLAGYAGRLAFRPQASRRWFALLVAVGVAATAVWLVTPLVGDSLTGAGPDHLTWALAFGGLLLVPRIAAGGSTSAVVTAVALLTAAFWVKQPGALAGVVAAGWLGYQALRGRAAWRPVVTFVAALAVVNVVLLAIVNVATGGEQLAINVLLGQEHTRLYGARRVVEDAVRGLTPAALTAAALGLVCGWRGRGEASLPSLLLAFAVCALPFLMVFRAKQGGEDNQYLGTAWALALLAAAWWGAARGERRAAFRADLVLAAVVVVALLGTSANVGRLTVNGLAVSWVDTTADLRAYAAEHSVYHPLYSDVTYARDDRVWQDVPNVADLLAAGEPPGELLAAFLDRRLDAVVPFGAALSKTGFASFNDYASAYGEREAGWFWKLDRVVEERYAPVAPGPGVPEGVRERRPGPEHATWMRQCFGPFAIAGVDWEIRAGGGFWCHRPGTSRVVLRETPADRSELVTSDPVRWSGDVLVAPRGDAFAITAGGRLSVLGTRAGDGWEVTVGRAAPRRMTGRVLRVALPPSDGAARLSLWSDRGGAAFDLAALRVTR